MLLGLILLGLALIFNTYLEQNEIARDINKALESGDKDEINKTLNRVGKTYNCLETSKMLKNLSCSTEFTEKKDNAVAYHKDIEKHEEMQEIALKQLEEHRKELRKEAKQNEWDQEPVEGATNA